MTATKLREMAEAAYQPCLTSLWCGRCEPCKARNALKDAAPALARLVLELSEALETATEYVDWIENNFCASGRVGEPYQQVHRDIVYYVHGRPRHFLPDLKAAIDAVEKLQL